MAKSNSGANFSSQVEVVQYDGFDKFMDTDQVAAIYFGASWCEPCKEFIKTFNKVAVDLSKGFKFGYIDIEAQTQLSKDFNIRSVPTVIIFRDNIALSVETGVLSEQALVSLLEEASKLDMTEVHKGIVKKMVE